MPGKLGYSRFDKDGIIVAYREGQNVSQIAKRFGCSHQYVVKLARLAGLTRAIGTTEQASLKFRPVDVERLKLIRKTHGLKTNSAAIRFAIERLAESIKPRKGS